MPSIKDAAAEFLANKRVAVTGVSRKPENHGSNVVYKRLRERGYEVFAVNPNADEVEGDPSVPAQGSFTAAEARQVGEQIGIDWPSAPFDVEQFRTGMDVELEHGLHDPATNVTNDDPIATGKIALAHLNEFPDYYTRLERMEDAAKRTCSTETVS
jgi:Protein of unknown function (DUF5661)/CoA binding domain